LCVDCGANIPSSRVEAVPTVSRCIKCQSEFEHTHDTRPHINEGLPGTRDENKKMRGRLWGDVRNRGRGH
jgi:RNA polymerase-binding transcription factor DksA